jgi:Asp-tRNA(Asn)/Glu-tRNA(Gln) amidotransferase A subunit family amidase
LIDDAIIALKDAGATTIEVSTPFDIDRLSEQIDVQRWEGQTNFNAYLEEHETPPVDSYQTFVHQGDYHSSIQENLLSAYGIDLPTDYRQYLDCRHHAELLRDRLHGVFAADDLDVIVFPHQKRPVAPIGETQRDRNGFLASGSGFPAITVPAGFTESGIPVGIEFLARPFEEAKLLSIAHSFEQTTHHRHPPELNA